MFITRHSYSGNQDLHRIIDLFSVSEGVDEQNKGLLLPGLEHDLNAPTLDPARDLSLWEDEQKQLLALGWLWVAPSGNPLDASLEITIHPDIPPSDLPSQIITWGEMRLREVAGERGTDAILYMSTDKDNLVQRNLLEQHSFRVQRQFLIMERSLHDPIPTPIFPPGFRPGFADREKDAAKCVALYNESFIDHWNHHPLTIQQFKHDLGEPDYRADLNLVAVAPDGTFAAFCYGSIDTEENTRTQRNEGWLVSLGTRRGYRKLGLGRALLRVGLQQLQAAGMDTANLKVDASNESGAVHFYESEGFQRVSIQLVYGKAL